MKKGCFFFLIFLFLFGGLLFSQENRGLKVLVKELGKNYKAGRQYLLLIAIDKYQVWPPLKNPVKDAKELKDILTSKYYIDEVIELYDEKATKANIIKTFENLQKKLQVNDSLLVIYSGHGHLDKTTNSGFWIPVNAGLDKYEQSNWLPNTQIRGLISNIKSIHLLIISDSCFSGDLLNSTRAMPDEINNQYFSKAYARISRQILTSGASETVPDESEFTRMLKMALLKNSSPYFDPLMLFNEIRLGVKGTMPMFGNLKDTGHQDGASFLLFLKEEVEKEVVKKEEVAKEEKKVETAPKEDKLPASAKVTEAEKKQTQEKVFDVSAKKLWQDTGIEISKGDHLIIKYISGKWNVDSFHMLTDGAGLKDQKFGDFPLSCLIGRIGKDDPFMVGNYYEIKEADKAGKLYVRMNDGDTSLTDNTGLIKIQIIINGEIKSVEKTEDVKPVAKVTEEKQLPGKLFNVSSQKLWQDTGITITKGDRVIIEYVSGKWTEYSANPEVDARGYYNKKFGEFPHSCLIGKIGEDDSFFIGNFCEIKEADKTGKLYVRMNSDNNISDNIGSIKIQIIINGEQKQ
jgi:hypothetical protein